MAVTIEWGNDAKTISQLSFVRPWSWDEFYSAYEKGYQMTESVPHTVNIILDFTRNDGGLPTNAITHFRKAAEKAHPRRGKVVIVSQRMTLVKLLVRVIERIVHLSTPILFADSIQEAHQLFRESTPDPNAL